MHPFTAEDIRGDYLVGAMEGTLANSLTFRVGGVMTACMYTPSRMMVRRYWIDEARGLYVGDALPARSDAIGSLVREDASSHLEHLPS